MLHFGIFILQLCVPFLSRYLRSVICILCSAGRNLNIDICNKFGKSANFVHETYLEMAVRASWVNP
jgi:hypothetical protein